MYTCLLESHSQKTNSIFLEHLAEVYRIRYEVITIIKIKL